jgi:hypothetical protein
MFQHSFRPYYIMGALIAVLLAITAGAGLLGAAGLFGGDIYRAFLPNESLLVGLPVQDAFSFLAAPLLVAAMIFTGRGSRRALVVWLGLLVYVIYYYAFYVVGFIFNSYYPAYLALESLAVYSLIGLLSGVNLADFRRHVSDRMPVRSISVILAITLLIAPLWIAALAQSLATKTVPDIALVWVLDLGFLLPAITLAAVQLWRRQPFGYVLARCDADEGDHFGPAVDAGHAAADADEPGRCGGTARLLRLPAGRGDRGARVVHASPGCRAGDRGAARDFVSRGTIRPAEFFRK